MDVRTRKRLREAKRKARSELDARHGWNSQGLAKAFDKTKWDFEDNVPRVMTVPMMRLLMRMMHHDGDNE